MGEQASTFTGNEVFRKIYEAVGGGAGFWCRVVYAYIDTPSSFAEIEYFTVGKESVSIRRIKGQNRIVINSSQFGNTRENVMNHVGVKPKEQKRGTRIFVKKMEGNGANYEVMWNTGLDSYKTYKRRKRV